MRSKDFIQIFCLKKFIRNLSKNKFELLFLITLSLSQPWELNKAARFQIMTLFTGFFNKMSEGFDT